MKLYGAIAAWLVVVPAYADASKQECIDASAQAQSLEHDGKLVASRRELLVCASATCQMLVGDDCMRRLDTLGQRIPSVLFDVTDSDGNDLEPVTVTVDHEPLVSRRAEAPILVDPGEHVFTFETAGFQRLETHVTLREGEKARHEHIMLSAAYRPPTSTATDIPVTTSRQPLSLAKTTPEPPTNTDSDTSPERRTGRIAGFTLIGVGLAFVGTTILFGYLGGRQNAAITTGGFASGSDIASADGLGDAFNIAFVVTLVSSVVFEGIGIPLLLANLGRSPKSVSSRGNGFAIQW
jgi:hypothetical protein